VAFEVLRDATVARFKAYATQASKERDRKAAAATVRKLVQFNSLVVTPLVEKVGGLGLACVVGEGGGWRGARCWWKRWAAARRGRGCLGGGHWSVSGAGRGSLLHPHLTPPPSNVPAQVKGVAAAKDAAKEIAEIMAKAQEAAKKEGQEVPGAEGAEASTSEGAAAGAEAAAAAAAAAGAKPDAVEEVKKSIAATRGEFGGWRGAAAGFLVGAWCRPGGGVV
jgi:hypothetical protein